MYTVKFKFEEKGLESMLLENVWKYDFDPRTKIVETHVRRLLAKLNPHENEAPLIEKVEDGYVIRAPA